jgi:hypothetical protein
MGMELEIFILGFLVFLSLLIFFGIWSSARVFFPDKPATIDLVNDEGGKDRYEEQN